MEFCHREEEKWAFEILTERTDVIEFPYFDLKISLAELYEEVQFTPA